jgi:hypothetical protein
MIYFQSYRIRPILNTSLFEKFLFNFNAEHGALTQCPACGNVMGRIKPPRNYVANVSAAAAAAADTKRGGGEGEGGAITGDN